MRKAILMMLLAFVSGSATAEWVRIGSGESQANFADPTTIKRSGSKVRMWVMEDLDEAERTAGMSYISVKALFEFDCKEEQYRILEAFYYAKRMGTGGTVGNDNIPSNWSGIPPQSVGQTHLKFACGKK